MDFNLITIQVTPAQLQFLAHREDVLKMLESLLMAITMSAPLCKIAETAQRAEALITLLREVK